MCLRCTERHAHLVPMRHRMSGGQIEGERRTKFAMLAFSVSAQPVCRPCRVVEVMPSTWVAREGERCHPPLLLFSFDGASDLRPSQICLPTG